MLAAMVCVQVSALALDNDHHESSHCCALCHVGMPFLQPATSAPAPPALFMVWLATAGDQETPHVVFLAHASSRAPPA